jgi:hypothetical protein
MDADADAVESELNHTPMERNRDLKEEEEEEEEPLLRPRPSPLSDSGRDHAGLRGHRSCSGFRLPDPDPDDDDDGARVPRRSRPAMLRGPQWLVGRRGRVSRRALPPPPQSAANIIGDKTLVVARDRVQGQGRSCGGAGRGGGRVAAAGRAA